MTETVAVKKWRLGNLRNIRDEHLFNLQQGVGFAPFHYKAVSQLNFEIRELNRQIDEATETEPEDA